MNISFFSLKGGVGKTSIAFNLALELEYPFIENDKYGGVSDILNESTRIPIAVLVDSNEEYIPLRSKAIYDFSSCVDKRSKVILKKSDLVIVPTLYSHQDIKMTVQCVKTLQGLGQNNILIVVNRVNKNRKRKKDGKYIDYINTKKILLDALGSENIRFTYIIESRGWSKSIERGTSIIELVANDNLMKQHYEQAEIDLIKIKIKATDENR